MKEAVLLKLHTVTDAPQTPQVEAKKFEIEALKESIPAMAGGSATKTAAQNQLVALKGELGTLLAARSQFLKDEKEAAKADAVQAKEAAKDKMAKENADKQTSLEAEVAARAAAHASTVLSTVAKHEAERAASKVAL